jgi:tetratricopeptide (TPR) repeat protein
MPTVTTDFRRDFAIVAIIVAGATSGCSWLGVRDRGETIEAPRPDAFAETRAQMALAPREPYWPFHLGELYLAADSTALAINNLNSALAKDPLYAPAVSLLSKIYYDTKMHAQAVTLLEDYLARNPQAPDALHASLALHCEALGDVAKADAALDGTAADAQATAGARALASLRHNDSTAMMEASRRALDHEKSAANHNNYGIALLLAGRPVEARDAFRAALDIETALPGALYNMAIVEAFYFFDDGAAREWFARYRRVASDDPDNLKAHFESDVSTREPSRQ